MKTENEERYPKLDVHMFGKFQIINKDKILDAETMHSERMMCLWTYLIIHRNRAVAAKELYEVLWSEDEIENPANALKNLIYRLRKLLNREWGTRGIYILGGKGTYQMNPEICMRVDVEEFEKCSKDLFHSQNREYQKKIGMEAVELYKDMFLSELSSEYWVISRSTYYHSIYLSVVKKLIKILEEDQQYILMEEMCRKVIHIEPINEEIHCCLMRALIADNKQKIAEEHYRETARYLYDSLGVRPSHEMENIYEELQQIQHEQENNIDIIQEDLMEKQTEGAFFCEYGVFRKIYALESRSSRRLGIPIHLALVSLYVDFRLPKDEKVHKKIISEGMESLEQTLSVGLRSSDIVCRYSSNQSLIMLPACRYEDAKRVMNRLKNLFYRSKKSHKVIFQYSINEIKTGN